jgi:hypothetical protein
VGAIQLRLNREFIKRGGGVVGQPYILILRSACRLKERREGAEKRLLHT